MHPRMGYLLVLLLGTGIGWGLKSLSHTPQQISPAQALVVPHDSAMTANTPSCAPSEQATATSVSQVAVNDAPPASHDTTQNRDVLEVTQKLAQTFAEQKDLARENAQAEMAFSREWNEEEEDWQMQTQLSDFLVLHPDASRIQLYSTRCNKKGCQLIGTADFDHHAWGAVVEAMKATDWWGFRGTTSHFSSDGGSTTFVLYLER